MNINLPPMRTVMVQNQYGEKMVKIIFPYDINLLYKVRTIVGRKYDSEQKIWIAPIYLETLLSLQRWGFVLDTKLTEYIFKIQNQGDKLSLKKIKGLKGKPFPYQYDGVAFIEQHNGRALIADEMGLGKTMEALAWFQLHRDRVPVLIVCPASLKLNWQREIEKWIPNPVVEILSGKTPWKPTGDIIIINYDILSNWLERLQKLAIQILILDEVHLIKNNAAKRTKAVKRLGKHISYIIALSGTPIVNRPIEIYNAVNLINPLLFPNYMDYARTYCDAKYNGYGWDFNGTSNTKELHKILTETIMIRRLKKDVLKDLPEIIHAFVPIEINNEAKYKFAEHNFIEFVRQNKGEAAAEKANRAKQLSQIEGLKQIAVTGKLKGIITWINDYIGTGNKLVVFGHHHFVIEALINAFPKISVNTIKDKQTAIDKFQNDPDILLFIGRIEADAEGHNLTAASGVAVIEFPWTPGKLDQLIARIHRIGQKASSITAYYLMANNTIEERIAHLLDKKRKTLNAVLDGKDTETKSLLGELINQYKNYETK